MQKPSLPKGTRDFLPTEFRKRAYIKNTIETYFERYAFAPLETPSFENLSVLTGKYGEEGDRLIFKILNSGAFTKKLNAQQLGNPNETEWLPLISDKALRYDLTVPFARVVAQHQNELAMPFRRYQIQNVWRADRPQKGRFREFMQCDADIIGSDSLLSECDLIHLYAGVFHALNLPVAIQINNRKILQGIAETVGITDFFVDFTVGLDKLDKVGSEKVQHEWIERGIPSEKVSQLAFVLEESSGEQALLSKLDELFVNSEVGKKGMQELRFVLDKSQDLKGAELTFNLTLARGIDYYTGCILEVTAKHVQMGSIGGGGRYDDLTAIFGLKDISGVGISFGLDRIYLVLEELNLFPESTQPERVLFLNMGEKEADFALEVIADLRQKNVASWLYPDAAKFKKQMQYANKEAVPYVAIIGSEELATESINLKNMETGEQKSLPKSDFLNQF